MNLWYISIGLSRESFDTLYCYEFTKHTRFISNYLSRRVRTIRFKTDGTYRMISVELDPEGSSSCERIYGDVLKIGLHFEQEVYEQIRGSSDCEFYLKKLDEGFRVASQFKTIPLRECLGFLQDFRDCGYVNDWLHKKRRFKDHDVEVFLNCYFTTLDFKLVATITRLSTKEELCSGVVLQTEPDELCFDKEFKDILIDGRNIVITDFLDRPNILINLDRATEKTLTFEKLSNQVKM
jgi:hypothetical protein